jgi:hypothetical protein
VSYFFNEAARVEHLEHVAYYESCQIGLGARYLLAFDAAMGAVCEAPDRYRVEFPPAIRKYRVSFGAWRRGGVGRPIASGLPWRSPAG